MSLNILSGEGLRALERFVTPTTSFAFDYDGTLAPIVADPDRAFMRDETRSLVRKLASPTLLLTGRSVKSARALTRPLRFDLVIGSHGAEWSNHAHDAPKLDSVWRKRFAREMTRFDGVFFEDKGQSLAVHFRNVTSIKDRKAIASIVHAQTHLRIVAGKSVYNLVAKRALDKGSALTTARSDMGLKRVLFFGDDVTDEDVFRVNAPWLMSIRIGRKRASKARFHLSSQSDIDTLLALLA